MPFSHFSSRYAGEKVFWHSEREVYSHQALMNTSTTTTRPADGNKYVTYTSGNSARDVLGPPEYGSPAPKWKWLNRSLKVKLPLNKTSWDTPVLRVQVQKCSNLFQSKAHMCVQAASTKTDTFCQITTCKQWAWLCKYAQLSALIKPFFFSHSSQMFFAWKSS